MAYGVPFSVNVRPSVSGEEPNLRFQRPLLINATGLAPTRSSPGRNVRPKAGFTPSKSKKLAETMSAGRHSGSTILVRLKSSERQAASPENERFSRTQSRKFGQEMDQFCPW